MQATDIESQCHELQSSLVSSRFRQRRSRIDSGPANQGHNLEVNAGTQADGSTTEILPLLQLMGKYDIRHLAITPLQGYNLRESLGKGASFLVEEANLPISESLSHLRYRDMRVGGIDGKDFIDHTKTAWRSDSRVAYKTLRESRHRRRNLGAVISDLQVLCHPPLKDYIVRLAGVAWTLDTSSEDNKPVEWPIVVTEKAPLGSIRHFFRSHMANENSISLRTKLNMCVQVLRSIEGLHACGIVHCDIKCENALVFKPEGSRADFWKVKLSDFGNSLVDVDYYSPEDIIDVEPIGTPLYIAPELQIPGHRRAKNLKAIDIWSWGLLLWEVVTSGARYTSTYNTSSVSIEDERTDLCTKGYKACENFIRQFHFHERGELGPGILEALRLSLDPDPSSRPSATTLLQRLGPLNGDFHSIIFQGEKVQLLDQLPLFELCDHFYGLIGFPTVPYQVFDALKESSESSGSIRSRHFLFQLGLCIATGFGTDLDYGESLRVIHETAHSGYPRARIITKRLHEALGVPIPSSDDSLLQSWLMEAAQSGSHTALIDLRRYYPEIHKSISNDSHPIPLCVWQKQLRKICDALSAADDTTFQARVQEVDLGQTGPCGDTILHWCAFLPSHMSIRIAELLLSKGVPLSLATHSSCSVTSNANHFGQLENTMPPNTTSLDWAIIEDNVPLMRLLLPAFKNADNFQPYGFSAYTPLTCSSHFQSLKCLEYLLSSENLAEFDGFGFSPLFHALRPDLLFRILRYSPGFESANIYPLLASMDMMRASDQESGIQLKMPPFVQRELHTVGVLVSHNPNIRVHKLNDFNHFHLTAALAHPMILRFLLDNDLFSSKALINKFSVDGKTPLACIVAQGNVDAFQMFLNAGADPRATFRKERYHALHLCCLYRRASLLEVFAPKLLEDDPSCVNSHESLFTPLHVAAICGNKEMIALLMSHGAFLYRIADQHYPFTALGAAVLFRSVVGVRELARRHRELKTSLVAGFWCYSIPLPCVMVPLRIVRHITPAGLLLAPGSETKIKDLDWSNIPFQYLIKGYPGSCELPMSTVSSKILKILRADTTTEGLIAFGKRKYFEMQQVYRLQQNHDFGISFVIGTIYRIFTGFFAWLVSNHHELDPGTRWAVRMGNLTAIQTILPSHDLNSSPENSGTHNCYGEIHLDLRSIIDLAQRQLYQGNSHIASETARIAVVEYLEGLQRDEFARDQQSRMTKGLQHQHRFSVSWLKYFWMFYYKCYGTLEQNQFEKYNKWFLNKRPSLNPMIFEFQPFFHFKVSIYPPLYIVMWAVLGQFLRHLAALASDPVSRYDARNGLWAAFVVLAINLTPFWAIFFRVGSVYFDAMFKSFPGLTHRHSFFQLLLVGFNVPCCIVAAMSLNPDAGRIIRFHSQPLGNSTNSAWDGYDLALQEQSILAALQNGSSSLVAWLVVVSLLPVILFFFCLFLKFMRVSLRGSSFQTRTSRKLFVYGNVFVRQ